MYSLYNTGKGSAGRVDKLRILAWVLMGSF